MRGDAGASLGVVKRGAAVGEPSYACPANECVCVFESARVCVCWMVSYVGTTMSNADTKRNICETEAWSDSPINTGAIPAACSFHKSKQKHAPRMMLLLRGATVTPGGTPTRLRSG